MNSRILSALARTTEWEYHAKQKLIEQALGGKPLCPACLSNETYPQDDHGRYGCSSCGHNFDWELSQGTPVNPEGKQVHGLLAGQPLCGFSVEPPCNWPPGDIWTWVHDGENINCDGCRARLRDVLQRLEAERD